MQAQLKAKYIESMPIVGALPGEKDVFSYKGFRYSIFYHPIYKSYQIGIAAPNKAAHGLLGRGWQDVANDSAPSLEEAHALAQAEIDRMKAEGRAATRKKKRATATRESRTVTASQ